MNAKSEYFRLLRLNGLLPSNPTNSGHFTRDIAVKIFQLAQAGRDANLDPMRSGEGVELKSYVKDIIVKVG